LIKIAIFGGSFDPPHKGHQAIIDRALERLDIDKIIIVPTFLNPFKSSSLAPPKERLKWCSRLFSNLSSVEVSDYEIVLGRPAYTEETLRYFQKRYSVEYLIIGADNLESITKWYLFEEINREIIWVVATRSKYKINTSMLREYIILDVAIDVSSTNIRECNDLRHIDKRIAYEVNLIIKNREKNDIR
jgi:nicotinate-nucleotide adenylyltransferase